MAESSYLDELNESQRKAVLYNDGPMLVIAGAGSGKTRVLTYKIAYLLDHGYEPWSVLALTFTNKAAREMKERIARQVGIDRARYLWMGTFHSIFSRILRMEAEKIGFTSSFTIYDSADSKSLIDEIVREMELDIKDYRSNRVLSLISNAKNRLLSPEDYAKDKEQRRIDSSHSVPKVYEIYSQYCIRCHQRNVMDFDDLLVYTYQLFETHPEICDYYASYFRYILVDEYQDTNLVQHKLVLKLSSKHRHLCVVGDDAQSIYSFRGANIDFILSFARERNVRVFKLEQNYRSTQTIVNASNSLINKNENQIRKNVFSENDKGEPLSILRAFNDIDESEIVANTIIELHHKGYAYNDFAVLYRTNAQSTCFENTFRKKGVPYQIFGGTSFYQSKEIKNIIAYFRLVVNSDDDEAFRRIVNYPTRGIGDTTFVKLKNVAKQKNVSLWKILCGDLNEMKLTKTNITNLHRFRELIESFKRDLTVKDAEELGHDIICNSGIIGNLNRGLTPENLSQLAKIDNLLNDIKRFCEKKRNDGSSNIFLADYLMEAALLTDADRDDNDVPKVMLMTVHSAKGLEFSNVFVVGMEDGLFPDVTSEVEEERRLFYVAITRAETHCYLTYAKCRYRYGELIRCHPSPFLKEIDSCFRKGVIEEQVYNSGISQPHWGKDKELSLSGCSMFDGGEMPQEPHRFVAPRKLRKIDSSSVPASSSVGQMSGDSLEGKHIEHERFGRGVVEKVEGAGDNRKATVRFENAGVKQLLLKFARFKVCE
ncbi:ATP-dependent helicase [Bacteroides sp. ET225]|uniref:ATP-dependent helicase n=1 Tax=Bacteroides sp. ET225 TaxID=2972461 RepID=UPI0021AC9A17|nr:UvrD-helicase domain-containing protein [Bacteroides sp. ET225]MCR8916883.1 UvrD-helicase domain-containing protein [Bacteroides sp. ET225]